MTTIAHLRETMWRRHRHPFSGWSRFALALLLGVAIWHHAWWFVAVLALAIATNPFWTPPPRDGHHFMTRAVDGERIWLARAGLVEKLLLMGFPGLLVVPLLWALVTQHALWTAFFGFLVLGQKFVFLLWTAEIARNESYDPAVGPDVRVVR